MNEKINENISNRRVPKKKVSRRETLAYLLLFFTLVWMANTDGSCKSPIRAWVYVEIFGLGGLLLILLATRIDAVFIKFESFLKSAKILISMLVLFWQCIGGYWIHIDLNCYDNWTSVYILIFLLNLLLLLSFLYILILLSILLIPDLFKKTKDD